MELDNLQNEGPGFEEFFEKLKRKYLFKKNEPSVIRSIIEETNHFLRGLMSKEIIKDYDEMCVNLSPHGDVINLDFTDMITILTTKNKLL